jgi:tetratricopeptide (TPR) repeat protein
MQMAAISQSLHLGIEQRCMQACEKLAGASVELALWKANEQMRSGEKSKALGVFDTVRAGAGTVAARNGDSAVAWDSARARLLEMLGDNGARQAWQTLADGHPKDVQVQWLALSAPSAQGDRAFVRRVLDRISDEMGDQGLRWRMTQSRWLLDDTANAQSAAEAALILKQITSDAPDLLSARLMLAECLMKLGNYTGAVAQLTDAAGRSPESNVVSLKLASLLQSHGESGRARSYINRVIENSQSRLTEIREAAQLLDAAGDPAAALAALEHAYGDALKDTPPDMLLARLYLRTNQPQKVDAVCKRLLVKPGAAELRFAADFYASTGRAADAEAAMKRLDTVPTAPGEKEMARGEFQLRAGNRKEAQALFTAATQAAPKNGNAWRQLIRVQLADQQDAAALATARGASLAVSDDAGIAAFIRTGPVAEALKKSWPEMMPLAAELLARPDQEQTFSGAADIVAKAQKAPLSASALNDLSSLAAGHPDLFPLQVMTARACLAAGRTDDATAIARRTQTARPGSELSNQFAAQTAVAAKRWDDVAEMLRPKLAGSAEARVGWMKFAVNVLPDVATSKAWLNEVEPLALKGEINERLALAECWQSLAQKSKDPEADEHAGKLIAAVAASPDAGKLPVLRVLSLGCMQEARGQTAPAEASYRKAVELDPKIGIPQNNLAMLLAKQHNRVDEALKYATEAVAVGGDNGASFLDTLAFVQGQRGDYAAAVDAAQKAAALRPAEPRFQIRLANMLIDNKQGDRAKSILQQIQSQPGLDKSPPDVLKDLQSLRQRLGQTASAAS